MKSSTVQLTALRDVLKERNFQAYIIPTEDAHYSEYAAACDARRAFISGFTGSAGTAVVTVTNGACLWTDGRYYLQASQQLDSNWTLQKMGLPETPTQEEWLAKVLPSASVVAIDPKLFTIGCFER